jgi:hypothetical protein
LLANAKLYKQRKSKGKKSSKSTRQSSPDIVDSDYEGSSSSHSNVADSDESEEESKSGTLSESSDDEHDSLSVSDDSFIVDSDTETIPSQKPQRSKSDTRSSDKSARRSSDKVPRSSSVNSPRTSSEKHEDDGKFKKPTGPAPKRKTDLKAKKISKKIVDTDSDTDYFSEHELENFKKVTEMLKRGKSSSVDRKFMTDTVRETSNYIMRKPKAKERTLSQGQLALVEFTSRGEKVSAKSYVKALNYLIHFAPPRECISFLYDHRIKERPDVPVIGDSKIINGVNCVRKRMNLLYDGLKRKKYNPRSEHETKALSKWGTARIFKVTDWQEYLIQFSEDYQGGLTDDESSDKTSTGSSSSQSSTTTIAKKTGGPSSGNVPIFVPGGQLNPAGGQLFAPGLQYVTVAQREAAPLSLDDMKKLSKEELERRLLAPKATSSNDAAVADAVKSSGTRSDEWRRQFNVAILPGERKFQRDEYNKWWSQNSSAGSVILPDELVMPPIDATDLLGKTDQDESDPNQFSTPVSERFQKALEDYYAIRACSSRVIRDCYHKSHRNSPMFIPYLEYMKTSMFNHFTRMSSFTSSFNVNKQTGPFMTAMDDIDKCIAKLEEAKLSPEEDQEYRDKNSAEIPITFKEHKGQSFVKMIMLPIGWDDPILPFDSPEAVQFRTHNSLKSTGEFNGKDPSQFISWWNMFKEKVHLVPGVSNCDKWEHLVDNKLLHGDALEVFLGGADVSREEIDDRDTDYIYGMSRLCIQYDRADNKWERLWSEVEKLKVDKTDTKSTRDGLYKVLRLLTKLQKAKPDNLTRDDVARRLHGLKRHNYSSVLLSMISTHTNKEEMQRKRRLGQHDYYVRKYLENVIQDVTTVGYSAEYTEKSKEKQYLKRMIDMFQAKDGKSSGGAIPDSSKRVKFDHTSSQKNSEGTAKKQFKPILRKSKLDVSKMTSTPGFVTVGKKIPSARVASLVSDLDVFMATDGESSDDEVIDDTNHIIQEDVHMSEIAQLQDQVQMLASLVASNQASTSSRSSHKVAREEVAQANTEVDAAVKLAKEIKWVQLIKNENCFFSHKSEKIQHKLWDCALPQMRKADDLAKRNQCRICWAKGHIAPDCTSKIPVSCDYCKKTGHWQPFCGMYISKAYTSNGRQDSTSTSQHAAAADNETLEQFELKLNNQAVHAAREEASSSDAIIQHCSLLSGVPIGLRPNNIQNS